jgi:hypothetical protein
MSVQKKSLIGNREAVKKAIVASQAPVSNDEVQKASTLAKSNRWGKLTRLGKSTRTGKSTRVPKMQAL